MTKNKKSAKVYVKKPKIGESYWFWFAGSITHGVLLKSCEKLTEHYGEPWYTLESKDGTKYPVSIFTLRYDKPNYKEDV